MSSYVSFCGFSRKFHLNLFTDHFYPKCMTEKQKLWHFQPDTLWKLRMMMFLKDNVISSICYGYYDSPKWFWESFNQA